MLWVDKCVGLPSFETQKSLWTSEKSKMISWELFLADLQIPIKLLKSPERISSWDNVENKLQSSCCEKDCEKGIRS